MSLERSFEYSPSSPEAWALAIERRPTPLGEYLGSIAASTWSGTTSIGAAIDELALPDIIGTRQGPKGGLIRTGQGLTPLDEDQFKASPDWREGIPWQSGMSAERLKVLARQHDEEAWRRQLQARYQGGFGGRTLGFLTALGVSAADPLNFIPFIGEGAKAAALARFGGIGGRALVYGAEATAGAALLEPVLWRHYNERGFEYGIGDVAMDLGLSALAGAGIGSLAGAFAARRLRREDAGAALDALELAAQQQARGEPVDVRAIAEAGRQRLDPAALGGDGFRFGPAAAPEWKVGNDLEPRLARRPVVPTEVPDRVFTAAGRAVDVRYEVVDAASLVASHTDDLGVNPAFPAELQPRDRGRAASQQQVASIASDLNPELLGRSASAADGAPIVGPDGIVESGNGRVLALRRAFRDNLPGAQRYRQWLADQGFDTAGMAEPVLVRRRTSALDGPDRAAFAREANERSTAAMSPAERAMADAKSLTPQLLALIDGPDVHSPGNRNFVRAFVGQVASPADAGSLMTADGSLSKLGADRIRAALLASAYGAPDLVARLVDEPDSGLGGLGQAMVDVAPQWARLRAAIARGEVAPESDGTTGLVEAVRSIVTAKDAGNPLHFALTQIDMFGGGLSADGKAWLASLVAFDKKGASKPLARDVLVDRLRRYVDEAGKKVPGGGLFGTLPETPRDILAGLGFVAPVPSQHLAFRELLDALEVVWTPVARPPAGIEAWHGSPHHFQRFDLRRIGSGEGAQAYGHGLYFAQARGVAVSYRDKLSYKDVVRQFREELPDAADADEVMELVAAGRASPNLKRLLKALEADGWLGFDSPAQAIVAAFRDLKNFDPSDELRAAVQDFGALYRVRIDAKESDLLQWDQPLRAQGAKVQAFVRANEVDLKAFLANVSNGELTTFDDVLDNLYGNDLHKLVWLKNTPAGETLEEDGLGFVDPSARGQAAAARAMRDAGIPGIAYLDGMSRGAGEGNFNFVVFDDSLVTIIDKNGEFLDPPPSVATTREPAAAMVDPWKVASPFPLGDQVDLQVAKARLYAAAPEAETFARDIDPELALLQEDVAALRRSEALPPGAERELEAAEVEAKRIEGWGDAYEALATCVVRFAA